MVDAGPPVRSGRAFEKDIIQPTLTLLAAFAENRALAPELEQGFLHIDNIQFWGYWFEHGLPPDTRE